MQKSCGFKFDPLARFFQGRDKHITLALIFYMFSAFLLFGQNLPDQDKVFDPSGQYAAGRVALLIGNDRYPNLDLHTPVEDVQFLARELEEVGFTCIVLTNADFRSMYNGVRQFIKDIKGAQVGLFYFSGLALQLKGKNHLVPVDVNSLEPVDLGFTTVDAGQILSLMQDSSCIVKLLVLDASSAGELAPDLNLGLAPMKALSGDSILFSAVPGTQRVSESTIPSSFVQAFVKYGLDFSKDLAPSLERMKTELKKADPPFDIWISSSLSESQEAAGPKAAGETQAQNTERRLDTSAYVVGLWRFLLNNPAWSPRVFQIEFFTDGTLKYKGASGRWKFQNNVLTFDINGFSLWVGSPKDAKTLEGNADSPEAGPSSWLAYRIR